MTGVTAGHYAVEEINSAIYSLNDILRCADAHKVSWLVLGHIGLYGFDNVIHHVCALTNGKTADSVAVTLDLANSLHILYTKILVSTALVDTKEHLTWVNSSLLFIEYPSPRGISSASG